MKNSQITVFIILGLVVFGLFAFMYKISHSAATEGVEDAADLVYKDFLDKTALREYIQTCLDNSAKEGLILAGLQGGNIYDYQVKGTYPSWALYVEGQDYLDFNFSLYEKNYSIKLRYWLTKPELFPDCEPTYYHCITPTYPYNGSLVEIPATKVKNSFGLASVKNSKETDKKIVPLCDERGANWANIPNASWSCELYDPGSEYNTQSFLQKFTANKTASCLNFSYFTGKNYLISFGGIESEVLIGEEDVMFALKYAVNVSLKGNPPITKFSVFYSNQNVKLKKIYELAHHIILEDVKNIFFNMTNLDDLNFYLSNACSDFIAGTRSSNKAPCFNESIFTNISIFKDICPDCKEGNHSYIVRIEDNTSRINGNPYIFQFAVENRIPALDLIDESVNNTFKYYTYLNNTFGKTPLQAYGPENLNSNIRAQNRVEIYPWAIDPDEEEVTYLIENSTYCCEFNLTNNNFTSTTLSINEHSINLYACDARGLETCLVEKDCSGTLKNCGNINNCSFCDYQTILINVTG